MNVHVYTAADARYKQIADRTWPLMNAWCAKHAYAFTPVTLVQNERSTSWQKLEVLNSARPEEVNIWMDADIFIRDKEQNLARWFPRDGIAFSSDAAGLCAGFFIFTGAWALEFLRFVRWCGPGVPPAARHEQSVIKMLAAVIPSIQERLTLMPTTVVTNREDQSCPYAEAWAYHAWASDWDDPAKGLEMLDKRLALA